LLGSLGYRAEAGLAYRARRRATDALPSLLQDHSSSGVLNTDSGQGEYCETELLEMTIVFRRAL